MVRRYGPRSIRDRGGCVAFDLLSMKGNRRDAVDVVSAANKNMISIKFRTGCFCNLGAAEHALVKMSRDEHWGAKDQNRYRQFHTLY